MYDQSDQTFHFFFKIKGLSRAFFMLDIISQFSHFQIKMLRLELVKKQLTFTLIQVLKYQRRILIPLLCSSKSLMLVVNNMRCSLAWAVGTLRFDGIVSIYHWL